MQSKHRHARETDRVTIEKTTHTTIFVIPGLTQNPDFFQIVTLLDAGSVIPDLIRDRHDAHKLNAFAAGN